jgi:hypothetical protein
MEPIKPSLLNNLPNELQLLIITNCNDLSKFILHFVSKKFRALTLDNNKNRDLGVSFVMYFIREYEYKSNIDQFNKLNKIRLCELAAKKGSLNILKWFRDNNYEWNKDICSGAAFNGARLKSFI